MSGFGQERCARVADGRIFSPMLDLDRGGARAMFIAGLLAAAFLLTLFLALRAQVASTYHRATAQKVVRDWSLVAADELLRRTESYVNYNGTYPLLQAISAEAQPPDRARVAALLPGEEGRRNARLVVHTFRGTLRDGHVDVSPGTPDEIRDWLAQHLPAAAAVPSSGDRKPLLAIIGGREHAFVYLVGQQRAVGMEVDRSAIEPFISLALTRPLLPKSLAEGRIGNDAIQVRVADGGGRELFRAGGAFTPLVTRRVDAGLLRGFAVETAIVPRVAPMLVIGGVPRSPLALYGGILAVTALLLVTAALQVRKERALARMRADFVASVSHELRTPLTQIRMFAETLLLDRVRSDDERKRALAVIDQETRRLSNVVENVLQFSRGERGTLSIAPHACDVVAAVRDTIELFAPIAAGRAVRVTLDAAGPLEASVDEGAVHQIVLNLLDNAVRYGPEGQEVVVHVERDGRTVRISVDDEGLGIPPRERRRVWSRYYRLGRESERAIAGAGIGLSVVRELVELHGGRARIEESPRGGARIVVEIPA
jgi:signal transduction histidine kinase